MSVNAVAVLREYGLSELACQFAMFIDRHEQGEQPAITMLAGLLSEAVQQGHVCLNLQQIGEAYPALIEALDFKESWQQSLLDNKTIGQPGDYKPMILTRENQLYLYKYWADERDVAELIQQRLNDAQGLDVKQLKQDLAEWHNPVDGVDWQKVAVILAVSRQFAVISGGPGTGKTTIVLKILQCLANQSRDLRIGLAAPTGKAAARLQQVTSQQQNTEVKTLHRLLGITEKNDRGRYHSGQLLPLDVLLIDEASMIDISLMAKLLRALPPTAGLILLGDSQQLASVESGAVLANLSESQQGHFSTEFLFKFTQLGIIQTPVKAGFLTDSFVRLQHSYRFDGRSFIGQLAKQVNLGESEAALTLLRQHNGSWQTTQDQILLDYLVKAYQPFIEMVEKQAHPKVVISVFEQFRMLAALKQGPQSVSSINRMMSRLLAQRGWRTHQAFYAGRPIMITQNDYRQHLFNGDIGVILQDTSGQLRACFCSDELLRWIPLNRLPAHETVFAMTVHKSQGSEFDEVSILLPDENSPILSRELLYTAITRARKAINVFSSEKVLEHTIHTRHQRESGLSQRLAS